MYDMALSQLISNDSIQTSQLMSSISQYITEPVTSAALSLQSYQEANHSRSYAVCAEEVCEDVDRIYEMHNHSEELRRKNNAVAEMYSKIYDGDEPSEQDLIIAFSANVILEELVFPGGFVALWSIGNKMVGTAKMISFIQRDEEGTHVPLFRNITRTAIQQVGITDETKQAITDMIIHMTDEEKIWTKHITKGNLGFSEAAIDMFIENQANKVFDHIGIESPYERTDGGPLLQIVNKYSMLSKTKIKANFFEVPVSDYAINELDDDY